MITAVDTNVLIDILEPDPVHGRTSLNLLRSAMRQGAVVARILALLADGVPQPCRPGPRSAFTERSRYAPGSWTPRWRSRPILRTRPQRGRKKFFDPVRHSSAKL